MIASSTMESTCHPGIDNGIDIRSPFQVLAEKTGCPEPQESPEFKESRVWTDPTERRVPEETWESREPQDSQDPEDPLVLPETPVWADPRVFRSVSSWLKLVLII